MRQRNKKETVNSSTEKVDDEKSKTYKKYPILVLFLIMVIDLIGFTMILPLMPRLLNDYAHAIHNEQHSLSYKLIRHLPEWRVWILNNIGHETMQVITGQPSLSTESLKEQTIDPVDLTLLGGAVLSIFSVLQFVMARPIGYATDRWGRRPILLLSMTLHAGSYFIWYWFRSMDAFLISRVLAGMTKASVQIAYTIVVDVTAPATRNKSIALIGVAFAIAFTTGPGAGAVLSLMAQQSQLSSDVLSRYELPVLTIMALNLLAALGTFIALPESLHGPWFEPEKQTKESKNTKDSNTLSRKTVSITLNIVNAIFLSLYSAVETLLPFVTFVHYGYGHAEQGKLLAYRGLASAIMQGGMARNKGDTNSQDHARSVYRLIQLGFLSTLLAASLLATVTGSSDRVTTLPLILATIGLSFTAATVVGGLVTLYSILILEGDTDHHDHGAQLADLRAWGQLGRALGPFIVALVQWLWGIDLAFHAVVIGVAFCMILLKWSFDKAT